MHRLPPLTMGPPDPPRTSVSVDRMEDGRIMVGFNESGGGHAEILSLADAEAMAEKIFAWVDVIRFQQMYGKPKE